MASSNENWERRYGGYRDPHCQSTASDMSGIWARRYSGRHRNVDAPFGPKAGRQTVVLFRLLKVGWQTLGEPPLAPDHDGLGVMNLSQNDQIVGGQVAGLGPDIGDVTQIR